MVGKPGEFNVSAKKIGLQYTAGGFIFDMMFKYRGSWPMSHYRMKSASSPSKGKANIMTLGKNFPLVQCHSCFMALMNTKYAVIKYLSYFFP